MEKVGYRVPGGEGRIKGSRGRRYDKKFQGEKVGYKVRGGEGRREGSRGEM